MASFRLKQSVTIHDALHGFRVGRGMVTVTLEAKLVQQLARTSQKPLFKVFLEVRKAYDPLDREQYMEILRGYSMEQNTAFLIAHHWDNLIFVPKAKSFLGTEFGTGRRVT